MNNGNLLNSLLGLTSANSAVTKASAAKARAESSEKFQQALEQVRPEVAARKPVVRKEAPAETAVNARSNSKPSVQRDSQHDVAKADARPTARENVQETPAKTAKKADVSAGEKCADAQAVAGSGKQQAAESDNPPLAEEAAATEGKNQAGNEVPVIALDVLLPTNPVSADTEGEAALPGTLVDLTSDAATQLLVTEEAANEALVNEEIVDPAQESEALVALDPGLLGLKAALESGISDQPSDSTEESIAPLVHSASQATQVGIATSLTDAKPLIGQATNAPLASQFAEDALAVTNAGTEGEVDVVAGVESDSGENPDFLLLNSKTALNKLAETAMTAAALDKAAPSADVLKSAPVSTVVEGLARLTESQSPAARAFVVQTGVPVPVGSPQWSQAVGDKVLWFAAQNVSAAEIRLDPPELGAMQVKVSVNQDQASVTFTSPHPAVREALDQQLNRLREMFSEQGLNLVNVDVSDKSFTQREQDEHTQHQASHDSDDEEAVPVAVTQVVSTRLVDHYA